MPGEPAGDAARGATPGSPGGRRRSDGGGRSHRSSLPLGDWGEPAERLDELYRRVEADALRTAEWYLSDRAWKRRGARVMRVVAAVGAITGAAMPLLELTGSAPGTSSYGFLALLLGAAALACDRFFGLTSGWMRDVATAQAVQRRLQTLQFDWASENVREVLGPTEGTASEAAERCLTVLRRFSEDVTELVRSETAEWMVEFSSGPAPLVMQSLGAGGARPDAYVPPARFPLPREPARTCRGNAPRNSPADQLRPAALGLDFSPSGV